MKNEPHIFCTLTNLAFMIIDVFPWVFASAEKLSSSKPLGGPGRLLLSLGQALLPNPGVPKRRDGPIRRPGT
jgi:hypothetical protein